MTDGALLSQYAKTAHGLLRAGTRFRIVGVVDPGSAGRDVRELLPAIDRSVPVFATIGDAVEGSTIRPEVCVVGVATHGGVLTPTLRKLLRTALEFDLGIVNGLHEFAGDVPELRALAVERGLRILDVRRPPSKPRFWTGSVWSVRAPRVPVLGMDCAIGKRTTALALQRHCSEAGMATEMIFTGQTGWLQGARYGFVLDATPNDFVSGELEHAIVACERDIAPELMLIEGQSALRNPSGPCGLELVISSGARHVVLQAAPGRKYFLGHETAKIEIPSVHSEVELLKMIGAETVAVTLNGEGLSPLEQTAVRDRLRGELGIPVVLPFEEGLEEVAGVLRRLVEATKRRAPEA